LQGPCARGRKGRWKMKWFDGYRMRLVVAGFVTAILFGGGSAKADFTFGEPINLGPTVNSSVNELDPCISANGLELYFHSTRPGGYGNCDLWVTTGQATATYGRHQEQQEVNLGGRRKILGRLLTAHPTKLTHIFQRTAYRSILPMSLLPEVPPLVLVGMAEAIYGFPCGWRRTKNGGSRKILGP